jgi:ABC-type uncharacterized transport system ATPase subunit
VTAAALELKGVTKRFGPVLANEAVDLSVAAGTMHAVVGENGAGKSTLMKIAYGQIRADAGSIAIRGTPVARGKHAPARALELGLGMVFQHFMLVGPMTVTENAVLGREKRVRGRPWVDLEGPAARLAELSVQFGLDVDPAARIEELSVGQKQRAEILKVLYQGASVLLLDEPTAVLTPAEARQLLDVLRQLVAGGKTVVLISHKLDEVCEVAERITVMRRGRVVEELAAGATPEAVARAMVGRPVLFEVARGPASPGDSVLEVDDLRVARSGGGREAVAGVSLRVRAGEIVGIAGVEGNGQSELLEALAGLRAAAGGTVRVAGEPIGGLTPRARQERGVGHVPEDRHQRGLVLEMSVAENLILGRQRGFAGPLGLDRAKIRAEAERRIAEADVRPPDPAARAIGLSGGNQQKLVVARELARPGLKLLLCAQPTRGVDIGAIEHIHRALVAARDRGLAILLVSAELSELKALSDRLVVLYKGRLVAELDGAALAAPDALERVGGMMTGAAPA